MNISKENNPILAVVSSSGNQIHFFNAKNFERIGVIDSPVTEPHELCFDPKRQLLYVSITYRSGFYRNNPEKSHEILVIDIDQFKVIDIIDISPEFAPHALVYNEKKDLLYVSVESGEGGILIINPNTRKVLDRISTEATGPHWFVTNPEGTKGYSSNKEAPFISVLDTHDKELIGKVSMPYGSEELAISPKGNRVYIPSPCLLGDYKEEQPTLSIINTETDKIIKTKSFSDLITPVHVTNDGKVLVGHTRFQNKNGERTRSMFSPAPGYVSVLDGESLNVLGTIEVDLLPITMRSSTDGTVGYVSNLRSGTISVLDLVNYKNVHTIEVDPGDPNADPSVNQGAHGIAYIER
ncbi:YncE family protein [Bacillus toyonensis]|uniref:YncE family protein n=1 Tax=Bacillus toyonensis TaxID=155322 RepID=UPI0036E48731